MSKKDEKSELPTAESSLAPQLGSDLKDLKTGKTDMRRLSKLGQLDPAWIAYFLMVPPEDGGDFSREFCDNYMNLRVSEDGWRVNKMVQGIGASKGTTTGAELVKKPNIFQRNITQRSWRKKADEEGKTIVE